MTMLHTFQGSYEKLRADFVTSDDSALTSYKSSDRPSDCWQAGEEVGGVGIIFIGEGSDGETFSWTLYGYRRASQDGVGPAEFICDGTGTLGTAVSEVGDLYADTIEVTTPGSWLDVPVAVDSGNNRVCKLCFDLCGYHYLYVLFTNVGGAGEVTGIQGYISYF